MAMLLGEHGKAMNALRQVVTLKKSVDTLSERAVCVATALVTFICVLFCVAIR
jgi:hypothetical protein